MSGGQRKPRVILVVEWDRSNKTGELRELFDEFQSCMGQKATG